MQIEHISRSYRRQIRNKKNCMWLFRRSTGCFNQQRLLRSASPACVSTTLQPVDESTQVSSTKSQRCPEKSTQGQQAKSQRSSKTVNPLTSIFVPSSTALKNRTFHKISAWLDQALTKVNAGQTFCENPSSRNPSSRKLFFVLPTCGWNSSSR